VIGAGKIQPVDPSQTAKLMATSIDELTGHHFERANCAKIEKHIARGKKCLVYFGNFVDIETGDMNYLNEVASFDTLNFFDPLDYFVVQD